MKIVFLFFCCPKINRVGLELVSPPLSVATTTTHANATTTTLAQVSQYLNPLSLQIMSRTKEFNCPTAGGTTAAAATNPVDEATTLSSSVLPNQQQGGAAAGAAAALGGCSSTLPAKMGVQDPEVSSLASDEISLGLLLACTRRRRFVLCLYFFRRHPLPLVLCRCYE